MPPSADPSGSLARGVIYVATGAAYVVEAAASRRQLQLSNPGLPAAIVTDDPAPPGDWQVVLPLPNPTRSLRDKHQMRRSPWVNTIFLDTDTYVAAPLDPVFALLDAGFDLAAHQLFEGHDYQLADVPDSFPEFNTGVIAFRRTPAVQALFDAWSEAYAAFHPRVTCDQRSFRHAVYHSGLRHTVLTPEYNFRPLSTNFGITDLRILHGRPLGAMPALKALMDVKLVHRAYVPRLGCVVSDFMTPRQVRRLWLAVTRELFATTTRPLRQRLRNLFRRSA